MKNLKTKIQKLNLTNALGVNLNGIATKFDGSTVAIKFTCDAMTGRCREVEGQTGFDLIYYNDTRLWITDSNCDLNRCNTQWMAK